MVEGRAAMSCVRGEATKTGGWDTGLSVAFGFLVLSSFFSSFFSLLALPSESCEDAGDGGSGGETPVRDDGDG